MNSVLTAPTPRISVIIPIYNVAAHVRACIESLRAQTLTDFDVVMVDDGSTDGSGDLALEAAAGDPRFRLITQPNAGLGAARNAGLDAATGDFIAFVDSDDRVMPDYLLRLFQTLKDTGGDWVACAIQSTGADGAGTRHSAIHGQADLALHGDARRYSFNDWSDVIAHFPSAWNKLYRRSLIEGLRFDEGVWFEDHGFFHRAAARTDHIIHLPEALYIQTRGRVGQITTQDSDRVFEQFDVLDTLQQQFDAGPFADGKTALARIASRLIFERSTIIADADRRTRFAAAARDFLSAHDLAYRTDWDKDIALSWGMEMAGDLPLSVILSWDGTDLAALTHTLDTLRPQTAPGHEVILTCHSTKARRKLDAARLDLPAHWHIHTAPRKGDGPAFNHGLKKARGAYVICVQTGDALPPWTLLERTEAMLRTNADFGISQMQLDHRDTGYVSYHNGMHDMALWPNGTPPPGLLKLTPMQALGLEAQSSAKTFRRGFLNDHALGFTNGTHADWALCLTAALLAERTTYIPHAGAVIAMRDLGFERWHRPLGARAMASGHSALVAAVKRKLPAATRARLPQGWQRKLFARALREQVYFGTATGRVPRTLMLAGSAWTAWRKGYGASRAARLDPFVGPRLAHLLDPVSLVRSKLGLGGTRDVTADGPAMDAPDALHAFDLDHHGVITLRADFQTAAYASVNFRAAPRGPAVFHISLRHAEKMIVCNSQTGAGQWKTEQSSTADLSGHLADVTVTFKPPLVRVALNGVEVLHLNNKFPELQTITGFDVQGVVSASDTVPQMPRDPLMLDSRLVLRMQDAADANTTLRATHVDADLLLIPAPEGTTSALLPAHLWRDLPLDAPLHLTLTQANQTDTLSVTRADVAARIEALLALPLADTDATLGLSALEHVRYGALMDLLSPSARTALDTLALTFGVQDFLHADDTASEDTGPQDTGPQDNTPAAPTLHDDPIAGEIASAIARIAQSQTAPPDLRPEPLDILAALHVSPEAQQPLFLALTEYFCTEGRDFEGLHQIAKTRGVLPFDPPKTRWSMSATLPYMLADKDYAYAVDTLRALAEPDADWLVTAGVAWTVRTAVLDPATPSSVRNDLFYAFAHLLDLRAGNYWDRVHCRELTRTAAALILHRDQLQPYQVHDAIALCLRVYGLSRQFWADLEDTSDLPADLLSARAAFATLMSAGAKPDARDHALRLFEGAGNADAARARREMFGPAGLPRLATTTSKPKPVGIEDLPRIQTKDTYATGEKILRHMAAPGTAPVTNDVATLARRALPDLYPNTPRAPYFDTQRSLSRQASDLDAGTGDIASTLASLTQLSGGPSQYLGLGMALALIDTHHDTQPAHVDTLCDWLHDQLAHLNDDEDTLWRTAPALIQPLRRLALRDALLPCVQTLLAALDITAPPASAADNAGLMDGNPLYDTIVTVFSCKPYLDSRIPEMRSGWLGLLADMGIPYVVVVGDGDGTRDGDIVHLDAPDDYEGLPQKTLAAIAWVHDNTRFGHMLKIDDDCFLNAPLFFGALSYRKCDYYGRRLYRAVGQMDRKWHQSKSSSVRGQHDLDKSPEPSEYTDGGTAYALSRTAMAAALNAADSPQGRKLVAVSFMEDKMLGDLLALRGIHPSEEDYRVTIRRRTYGAAIPVALWQNSFHASQTAEVKLVHLDTHLDQASALARLDMPGLWPRKIWPSYQDAQLGYQSNALELISSEASVQKARDAHVTVVACMRNEMFMLPQFLAHYRKLGVEAFLIADNCSDDGTLEYLADQPDVALFSVDTDYNLSRYGVAWQQAMMAAFRVGKWCLVADADELLVWQQKQTQTLGDLLKTDDFATANAARIFMLDMYPQGPLEDADFASGTPFDQAGFADRVPFLTKTLSQGPYSNQPSWTSALRHRLITGSAPSLFVAQKLALLRYQPWMRFSAGLHFVSDVDLAPRELLFAHFKYNADFRRKAQAEVVRGQHFNDAEEYRKYLALASEGRSVIYDADLSAPWSEVPFVKARLSR